MSGLSNSSEGNKTFVSYSARSGKFSVTVDEGTEGAVKVSGETSDGKKYEKYVLEYNELAGVITGIQTREASWGALQWEIELETEPGMADSETYVLNLPYSGRVSMHVLLKLHALDLTREVVLKAYGDFTSRDGKDIKGNISISQDGEKVNQWLFDPWPDEDGKPKDKKYPVIKKVKIKGKETFDDSDVMEFFEKYIAEELKFPEKVPF